jgi:gliding motility-associated-like protein
LPTGNWIINPGGITGNTASTTIAGLATGSYNFTVSNAAGCTSIASASVVINTQPASLAAPTVGTITQPTCAVKTGSVLLSGLPAGTWTINPGGITGNTSSTTISGLASGSHNFTVTDASGCISQASVSVVINNLPVAPSLSITSQVNVVCNGGSNGSITVTGSGGSSPYLYKLESGAFQNSGTFSSLAAGTYTITIQDAKSCTSTLQAIITEPSVLKVTYTSEDASCIDVANGRVTLIIEGGTQPYTILWSDGNNSLDRNDLLAGKYKVIVTDANRCASSVDVEVGLSGLSSCLEIQEIITPNNDGFYDTWKIKNIDMFPNAEVQVFNRWGKRVFSTKNISANEWDGKLDGKLLPTDSYHYILNLNDGSDPIRGIVTIVR